MKIALILLVAWSLVGLLACLCLLHGPGWRKIGRHFTTRGEQTLLVVGGPLMWVLLLVGQVWWALATAGRFIGASLKNWFFGKKT